MGFIATRAGTATVQLLIMAAWSTWSRSNLHSTVTLQDCSGAVLATQTGTGVAPFNVNLPTAGSYFLSIVGAAGNGGGTIGWSSFVSRGQYTLVVTYPANAVIPPTVSQPGHLPRLCTTHARAAVALW
jgi:hypothetical protein